MTELKLSLHSSSNKYCIKPITNSLLQPWQQMQQNQKKIATSFHKKHSLRWSPAHPNKHAHSPVKWSRLSSLKIYLQIKIRKSFSEPRNYIFALPWHLCIVNSLYSILNLISFFSFFFAFLPNHDECNYGSFLQFFCAAYSKCLVFRNHIFFACRIL